MTKGYRKPVFSPKTGKGREKGAPKPSVSFRSPEDLVQWIKKMEESGFDKTDLIVTALRVGRDVASRIGDKWFEIEYRAKRKGVAPGAMLAELALAAIATEDEEHPSPPASPPKKKG